MEKNMMVRLATMLTVVAFLMVMMGQTASAAGTAAGTAITNTASVTFNDGSNVKNKNSNSVTMYVAHHVTAAFTPASAQSTSSADNATYYYAIDFQNTGNRADSYDISFNAPTGYTLSLIKDDNEDGIHDAGEVTTVATTASIAVDAHSKYFIKAVIATLADNNLQDVIATFTSKAVNDVPGNIVVANPGQTFAFTLHSTIHKPVIAITATETAPTPKIPGATFNYAVAFVNSGSASPTGTATFAYTVPTNFAFNGGGSGTYSTGSYTINYTYVAPTITFTIPNAAILTGVAEQTFTFPVIIEQTTNGLTGPAAGTAIVTAITNFGSLTYNNGQTNLTATPSIGSGSFMGSTTVATSKGGKWTVTPTNAFASVDENVEYIYTLKNMGNAASTFTIADVQDGGTLALDVDHLIAATSYGTDLTTNPTASVTPGDSIHIYVRLTVPGTAVNTNTIARKISVTSIVAGTFYTGHLATDSSHTVTTTVQAATFTINLTVAAIAGSGTTSNPAPFDTLTFNLAIQNLSATTPVSSVAIQNGIPTNMTYVPESITVDGAAQTDAPADDFAQFSANTVKTEATLGVPASTTRNVRYKCVVN